MSENETQIREKYEVETPKDRVFGLRRGGRLGVTIHSYVEPQTWRDGIYAMIGGFAIALTGHYVVGGPVGTFAILFGMFWVGGAFERTRWMRDGDSVDVEPVETDLPDDAPAAITAAERVAERTRQEFIAAVEDEELAGRGAYAAMESLSEWFSEHSSAALMASAGDAATEVEERGEAE